MVSCIRLTHHGGFWRGPVKVGGTKTCKLNNAGYYLSIIYIFFYLFSIYFSIYYLHIFLSIIYIFFYLFSIFFSIYSLYFFLSILYIISIFISILSHIAEKLQARQFLKNCSSEKKPAACFQFLFFFIFCKTVFVDLTFQF